MNKLHEGAFSSSTDDILRSFCDRALLFCKTTYLIPWLVRFLLLQCTVQKEELLLITLCSNNLVRIQQLIVYRTFYIPPDTQQYLALMLGFGVVVDWDLSMIFCV